MNMTGINPTAGGNVNDLMPDLMPDSIPDSMSEVIGTWIIYIQYGMPQSTANSAQWRELLSLALNTGRDREDERFRVIMDWTWDTVLPVLQPLADERGFGEIWASMCTKRSADSASDAEAALANRTARFAQAARVARAAHSAAETDADTGTWFVKTAHGPPQSLSSLAKPGPQDSHNGKTLGQPSTRLRYCDAWLSIK